MGANRPLDAQTVDADGRSSNGLRQLAALRSSSVAQLRTHTLIHLDGIALGSLLALGLYTLALSRRTWLWTCLIAMVLGFAATATIAGGTRFLEFQPSRWHSLEQFSPPSPRQARATH